GYRKQTSVVRKDGTRLDPRSRVRSVGERQLSMPRVGPVAVVVRVRVIHGVVQSIACARLFAGIAPLESDAWPPHDGVEDLVMEEAEAIHVRPRVVLLESGDKRGILLNPGNRRKMFGECFQIPIRVVRERDRLVDDEPAVDSAIALHSGELLSVV